MTPVHTYARHHTNTHYHPYNQTQNELLFLESYVPERDRPRFHFLAHAALDVFEERRRKSLRFCFGGYVARYGDGSVSSIVQFIPPNHPHTHNSQAPRRPGVAAVVRAGWWGV